MGCFSEDLRNELKAINIKPLLFDNDDHMNNALMDLIKGRQPGGDLVGFKAGAPVEFDIQTRKNAWPGAFKIPRCHHEIGAGKLVYAWSDQGKVSKYTSQHVIKLIACNYMEIELVNVKSVGELRLWALYGLIDGGPRRAAAASGRFNEQLVSTREAQNMACSLVQQQWRECVSNPKYTVCRNRLLKEFEEIQ